MLRKAGIAALSLSLILAAACKSPEQRAAEDAAKKMEEAGKALAEKTQAGTANLGDAVAAMGAAVNAANAGRKVETVDYRELKEMLPESLPGMRRTDATGEKTAAMGMQVSHAEGRYSADNGGSVTLKITDIGSMTGLAGMAAYAWANVQVDRESDSGYEKTTTYNGFKAHEKYDKSSKSGDFSVLAGNRFVVEANGYNTEMDAIKGAVSKVDLRKLEGMKNKGVQ